MLTWLDTPSSRQQQVKDVKYSIKWGLRTYGKSIQKHSQNLYSQEAQWWSTKAVVEHKGCGGTVTAETSIRYLHSVVREAPYCQCGKKVPAHNDGPCQWPTTQGWWAFGTSPWKVTNTEGFHKSTRLDDLLPCV
jgi:hypothetical protein